MTGCIRVRTRAKDEPLVAPAFSYLRALIAYVVRDATDGAQVKANEQVGGPS